MLFTNASVVYYQRQQHGTATNEKRWWWCFSRSGVVYKDHHQGDPTICLGAYNNIHVPHLIDAIDKWLSHT